MLGRESRFVVTGDSLESVEFFLEHDGVFYPNPLRAERDRSVRIYPEAPGRYVLHAAWRSGTGGHGWVRTDFDVDGKRGCSPERITVAGETLWVPTAWDAHLSGSHESRVLRHLQQCIRRGATVYDIGANVGLFATHFAKWIGPDGWLYAVEPNPVCIYFLRANLERSRARNITILPVAVSNQRQYVQLQPQLRQQPDRSRQRFASLGQAWPSDRRGERQPGRTDRELQPAQPGLHQARRGRFRGQRRTGE